MFVKTLRCDAHRSGNHGWMDYDYTTLVQLPDFRFVEAVIDSVKLYYLHCRGLPSDEAVTVVEPAVLLSGEERRFVTAEALRRMGTLPEFPFAASEFHDTS